MAADPEVMKLLGSVPLFEGLSQKELESLARAGKQLEFEPERDIVEEGQSGVGFHLIVQGTARVIAKGNDVATLGPGDFFGEMSLIDGGPRSATVRTQTPLRTLSLTSWDFNPLVDANPSIARKLLVEMSKRLRAAESSFRH